MPNLKGGLACNVEEGRIQTTENWTREEGRATNFFEKKWKSRVSVYSEQGQNAF